VPAFDKGREPGGGKRLKKISDPTWHREKIWTTTRKEAEGLKMGVHLYRHPERKGEARGRRKGKRLGGGVSRVRNGGPRWFQGSDRRRLLSLGGKVGDKKSETKGGRGK